MIKFGGNKLSLCHLSVIKKKNTYKLNDLSFQLEHQTNTQEPVTMSTFQSGMKLIQP